MFCQLNKLHHVLDFNPQLVHTLKWKLLSYIIPLSQVIKTSIIIYSHTQKKTNFYDTCHSPPSQSKWSKFCGILYFSHYISILMIINPWLKLTTKIETCCTVLSINKVFRKFFLTYFIVTLQENKTKLFGSSMYNLRLQVATQFV
jgi:hypothetical protein